MGVKCEDYSSYKMARRLIREEGVLCGGSSGAAMAAAVQTARDRGPWQRCVVILPDNIRNYMTKHLQDEWLLDHGFDFVDQSTQMVPDGASSCSSECCPAG